jgi:phosphatidylserine/phosphatidylglycerophosphate/cardiolipin synthase-like enzyme
MRTMAQGTGIRVQAIAGTHAVVLAFDLDPPQCTACLGFAVHRLDHTSNPVEQFWLSSFKTFESVVPQPSATQRYSTFDHPIQSFYWGDFTAKPAHRYTYRVVARYGTAKNLSSADGVETTLDVITGDPDAGDHGVYFNRGVAASQAYAARFGLPPTKLTDAKRAEAMTWLSRGLFEALIAFIGQADSDKWALRAAVYEFTQSDVLAAFKASHDAGADVKVVYHDHDDSTGQSNEAAIADAGLPPAILVKRTVPKIAHNKFILLCQKSAGALTPVAVWTGSTNLSEGGIFGHSNVGHVIRLPEIAGRYLDYWNQLSADPTKSDLQAWCATNSPFDAAAIEAPGVHTLFSPRKGLAPLNWFGDKFASAPTVSNITLSFGMSKQLETPLEASNVHGVRYVMLNKRDGNQAVWSTPQEVQVAVGAAGGPDTLSRWARETLTGFNPLVGFLHTKILLVEALSASPTVVSGSANFSGPSTNDNDENMVIVNGDTEIADVFFTEYARMFQHFYARFWAQELKGTGGPSTRAFLSETPDWSDPYFDPASRKNMIRVLFSQVQANT